MTIRSLLSVFATALAALPAQQSPQPPLHTPIRTTALDGPSEPWARGHDYMVRFGAETVFIPKLGPRAAETARFQWKTRGLVAADGQKLEAATGDRDHAGFRCDTDLGFAIERYDVLADGLEQSFVLPARPALAGDLWLSGTVSGNLQAADRGPAHAPIEWRNAAGQVVVEYGAAFAIEADARRHDLATAVADGEVRICLPESLLATAKYPLTIDPLVVPRLLDTSNEWAELDPLSIARCPLSVERPIAMGQIESFSAGYQVLTVSLMRDDFSDRVELGSVWNLFDSPIDVSLGFGNGGQVLVLAFTWEYSSAPVYLMRIDPATGQSIGDTTTVPMIPQFKDSRPRIGGNLTGSSDDVLVVFERTPNWVDAPEVMGALFDVTTGAAQAPFTIAAGSAYTRVSRPAVSRDGAGLGWVVAWQSTSTLLGRHRVHARRVSVSGNLASGLLSSDRATTIHEIAPLVDGIGRYTIVWGEVDAIAHPQVTGDEAMALRAMRFDWGPLSATPDVLPSQELVAHSQRTERALSLAYDSTTRSHWALATRDLTTDSLRLRVAGMTGRQLRNELLHGGSINARGAVADVVYDAENRRFPIAYRTFGSPSQILGTFELHPDHPVTTYGTPACSTAQSSVTRDFLRGNEFATVALQNASASMPAALFVSAAPRSQSLSALGMTGCSLLVDLDALVCNLPGNTSANGAAYRTIALPETLSTMDVYAQWAFFAPGANPLGVVTTSGLHIRIR